MPDVHRASRIAHHASCTLDASLAPQRGAELRRFALVDSFEQRQGALAGMRLDLRTRFCATEGYFPDGVFFFFFYWGFCVNY
jgi:hypothetical protein